MSILNEILKSTLPSAVIHESYSLLMFLPLKAFVKNWEPSPLVAILSVTSVLNGINMFESQAISLGTARIFANVCNMSSQKGHISGKI